jgi:hypothetical protein
VGDPSWFLQLAEEGIETERLRRYRAIRPPALDEMDAFEAYSCCLHARQKDGRISLTDIVAWCELHGYVEIERRLRIVRLVQALERVFIKEGSRGEPSGRD